MKEIIKDIEGYENRYQISNKGRVLSLPNTSRHGVRELKQAKIASKKTIYRRVVLCKNGKIKQFAVHRLVAMNFIPNPENKPQVNHLDNNGEHNWENNLEWATGKENMAHSAKQGRQTKGRQLGCKAAAIAVRKRLIIRLKALLGERFHSVTNLPKGKTTACWVTFRCRDCSNIFQKRTDSDIVNRGGICTDCYKR